MMVPGSGLPPYAFATMGTVVSVRAGGTAEVARATALAASVFDRWDRRCSLYRLDSELSRIASGELELTEASRELRDAYALAVAWCGRTGGAFTPHRADGVIDLNGVVKAVAMGEAGASLTAMGLGDWGIDAGGDVLVSGTAADAEPWIIGIVDPWDPAKLLASLPLGGAGCDGGVHGGRRAVATSGTAERGDHIWSPTDSMDASFVQVSVAAGDIITADVVATAIVAGGEATLDELTGREQVDVLAVRRDGSLVATPGWPRAAPTALAG
jgi:thiamine biosynthesis lipoprotein